MSTLDELDEYYFRKNLTYNREETEALMNAAATGQLGFYKTTDAAPPEPLADHRSYELIGTGPGSSPSGTYTNLLGAGGTPVIIPAASSGHTIAYARVDWNGSYWVPDWQEVSIPTVDLTPYTTNAVFTPTKENVDNIMLGNIQTPVTYNQVLSGNTSSVTAYLSYDKPFARPGYLTSISFRLSLYSVSTQMFFTASKSGSTFTVKQVFTVPVTSGAGVKTIDLTSYNIYADAGDYLFIATSTNKITYQNDGAAPNTLGINTITSHTTTPATGVVYALGANQPTWSLDLLVTQNDILKILTAGNLYNSLTGAPLNAVPSVDLISKVNDKIAGVLNIGTATYPKVATDGYVIADGRFSSAANWSATDFIPVTAGDTITYQGTTSGSAQAIVLYNAQKSAINVLLGTQAINTPLSFVVPAGYTFVRMSSATAANPTFSVTSSRLKTESQDLTAVLKPVSALQNVIITPVVAGGYIGATGLFTPSASGWLATDFIPVSEGDTVVHKGLATASAQAIVAYAADKTTYQILLGNTALNDSKYYNVPAGFPYIRMSATSASSPVFSILKQMVKRSALPDGVNIQDRYPSYDWSAFGDSITWMNDNLLTYPVTNGGWLGLTKNNLGIPTHYNYGISGGKLADILNAQTGQHISKFNTVFIGTNDWTAGTPLGDFTNDYLGGTNTGTFAGDYRKFLDYIKSQNPGCITILMTPMFRGAVSGTTKPQATVPVSGQYLSQFADLVIKIAQYEGLGFVDLFRNGPINIGNCDIRSGVNQVTYDGVHPLDPGCIAISKQLIPVVRTHLY